MLRIEALESGYGPMQVLWEPSLEVKQGTITSLLGPNGVGKSTLLWTVLGSVQPWGGSIRYLGQDVTNLPAHKKVDLGITLVPEGKHLFVEMTVKENLIMGAYRKEAKRHMNESLDLVYALYDILDLCLHAHDGLLTIGHLIGHIAHLLIDSFNVGSIRVYLRILIRPGHTPSDQDHCHP